MAALFFQFIDLILHLDVHLVALSSQMGVWLYLVLFLIIFAETGLVVTPFLPGDSLLFAVGALSSLEGSALNIYTLWFILVVAAIMGDNCNYMIGSWVGPRLASQKKSRFINPAYFEQAQKFYQDHGRKTVFLARFLPILRTFAPFVAGVGRMNRRVFIAYSALGSVVWMSVFLGAGRIFGNIDWVKKNFSVLIMALVLVSFLPAIITVLRSKMRDA